GDVTLVHKEHGSTDGDDGRFTQIFQTSREIFRQKWGRTLRSRYKHEVLWQSIMNSPTGYAISCREILKALDQEGVRVVYRYAYGPGSPLPRLEPASSGDFLLDTFRLRSDGARHEISVVYGQGDIFGCGRGRRRVGFTMLEVDGFPKDWVR